MNSFGKDIKQQATAVRKIWNSIKVIDKDYKRQAELRAAWAKNLYKRTLGVILFLLCFSTAFAQDACTQWRGQVMIGEPDGTVEYMDNEVLVSFGYPTFVDDSGSEQTDYNQFQVNFYDLLSPDEPLTVTAWTGAIIAFYYDLTYTPGYGCQFLFGYEADMIFHDEFEG